MEDGWAVGGLPRGQDGLIGNLLPAASLEDWMTLVDTFACYPGLYLLHEIATQGGGLTHPCVECPGLGHSVTSSGTRGGNVRGRGAAAGAVSGSAG